MKTINEMKKEYGTVEYDGKTYILLQQAYSDIIGRDGHTVYTANAIAEGEQADTDGYVKVYTVIWELTDWARENFDEIEDESLMCDWDNPDEVKLTSGNYLSYNLETGLIC